VRADAREEDAVGNVVQFRRNRVEGPSLPELWREVIRLADEPPRPASVKLTVEQLDRMTYAEINALRREATRDRAEWDRLWKAGEIVRERGRDSELAASPDDSMISLDYQDLPVSRTTALNWIYKGKLTGQKQSTGPRGFRWLVRAGDVKRIRAEIAAQTAGR
jgi:hypothetical protein